MAKFKFAFEALKKLRENKVLIARKELMEVEARLRLVNDEHKIASLERAQLFEERSAGNLSSNQMCLTMELIDMQTQKLGQLEKKNLTLQGEFERHRNWVAHLGKELKIVERLEEKQRAEFDDRQRLKEKKIADSWVAENWSKKMLKEAQERGEQQ